MQGTAEAVRASSGSPAGYRSLLPGPFIESSEPRARALVRGRRSAQRTSGFPHSCPLAAFAQPLGRKSRWLDIKPRCCCCGRRRSSLLSSEEEEPALLSRMAEPPLRWRRPSRTFVRERPFVRASPASVPTRLFRALLVGSYGTPFMGS